MKGGGEVRRCDINEAWLDVIEKVDELISSNGNVLSSPINGNVIMKNFVSGMPTVTVGLNDKIVLQNLGKDTTNSIEMDDLKFHQCVNKKKFENERIIEFIPPRWRIRINVISIRYSN